MVLAPGSSFKQLWYRWKTLKLPWRKQFLVGLDLQGNTYWEFRDSLFSPSNRMRRIVKFSQPTTHYSDVQISPQWHQWLRHTRAQPPGLAELSQDILRQEQLKSLAAAADARWATESRENSLPDPSQEISSTPSSRRDHTNLPVPPNTDPSIQAKASTPNDKLSPVKASTTATPLASELSKYGSEKETSPHNCTDSTKKIYYKESWKHASGGSRNEWKPQTWDGKLAHRR